MKRMRKWSALTTTRSDSDDCVRVIQHNNIEGKRHNPASDITAWVLELPLDTRHGMVTYRLSVILWDSYIRDPLV